MVESVCIPACSTVPAAGEYTNVPATFAVASSWAGPRGAGLLIGAGCGQVMTGSVLAGAGPPPPGGLDPPGEMSFKSAFQEARRAVVPASSRSGRGGHEASTLRMSFPFHRGSLTVLDGGEGQTGDQTNSSPLNELERATYASHLREHSDSD